MFYLSILFPMTSSLWYWWLAAGSLPCTGCLLLPFFCQKRWESSAISWHALQAWRLVLWEFEALARPLRKAGFHHLRGGVTWKQKESYSTLFCSRGWASAHPSIRRRMLQRRAGHNPSPERKGCNVSWSWNSQGFAFLTKFSAVHTESGREETCRLSESSSEWSMCQKNKFCSC